MRLAICQNKLPAQCDIAGLEAVNFHYHPEAWRMNAPRDYVVKAFSNGIDPWTFDGPFVHDIESKHLFLSDGALFQKWHNIHLSARQRSAATFPDRDLWAFDVAGNNDSADEALARVCACRQVLDGYAAAGPGIYPERTESGDIIFDAKRCSWLIDAYKSISRFCWPHFEVIAWVTPHVGNVLAPLKVFAESCDLAKASGAAIAGLWQAPSLVAMPTDDYAKAIQPFIDCFKGYA